MEQRLEKQYAGEGGLQQNEGLEYLKFEICRARNKMMCG